MPWSVRLQDEHGEPVAAEDALIEFATIPQNEEFRRLRYLDPYGDAYFNRAQMEDFLADWDKLERSGSQVKQWQLVRDMATRCREDSHCYLRFYRGLNRSHQRDCR